MTILTEAKRSQRPAPVDTSGFIAAIRTLMQHFTAHPYGMKMNAAWVALARQQFGARKAEQTANYEEMGEQPPTDWQETLGEVIDAIWNRGRMELTAVKGSIDHEEHEYQHRAAERYDRLDDTDFWIESSDYLSAMNAMRQCAIQLEMIHPLSDPRSTQMIIDQLSRFHSEWDQHADPTDGGEAPILDADFTETIERLLPLMLLLYSPLQ